MLSIIKNCPKYNEKTGKLKKYGYDCCNCEYKDECLKRLTMPVIDDKQEEFNLKHKDEIEKAFRIFRP